MNRKFYRALAVFAATALMAGTMKALPTTGTDTPVKRPFITPRFTAPSMADDGSTLRMRHTDGISRAARRASKPSVRRAASAAPTVYGVVIYADNWTAANKPRGIYSFSPATGGTMALHAEATGGDFNAFCGTAYDGVYRFVTANIHEGTSYYEYAYYEYDVNTWQPLAEKTVYSRTHLAADYAYDATTGRVYGAFPGETGSSQDLATIDFTGYITTDIIATLSIPQVVAMAVSGEGTLYALSTDGNLYTVDKTTGQAQLVGPTGITPSDYAQSATFDLSTNRLYWACTLSDDTSALYEVDTTTGEATLAGTFPQNEEVTGLYIPAPLATDGAPSRAEDVTAQFADGALTGTVSFTVPTVTFGGELLTGPVTYTIESDGETLATGTTMAGAEVSVSVTLPRSGKTSLGVTLSNEAGKGPTARALFWAGPDTPMAPQSVKLSIDEESYVATVTWEAVTLGVNNGYVGQPTYDVVRMPDGVTVAQGLTETVFTETLSRDQLNNYYYTVTAVNGTLRSAATESNRQVAGAAYEVPFFDDPKTEDAEKLPFYEVYNVNGDDGRWGINFMGLCFESSWTAENNADDWLLTPPIHLTPGQSYIFSFQYRVGWKKHRLAVAYGKGSDYARYTELMPATEIDNSDFETFTREIVVTQDTIYRFGFHALSDGDASSMYVGSISVTKGSSDLAPDSVTALAVTPAPQGVLRATVSFSAPTKVANGDASLEAISRIDVLRGDELITTFANPTPGQSLSYTDEHPINGMNEYTVVAANTYGDGKKAQTSVWVGYDQPYAPIDVKVKDHENGITISWTPPTQTVGLHGGFVDPARLRYSVYDPTNYSAIITEHTTSLTAEDTKVVLDNDFQSLMYYSVFSEMETEAGVFMEGRPAFSPYMRIGKPIAIPYRESIANGEIENSGNWAEANYMRSWYTTSELSADGDGGCIYFTSADAGDWAIFHLPKMTLQGAQNPYFFFSYYAVPGADLQLEAQLLTPDYEPVTLKAIDLRNDTEGGWQHVAVSLGDYKAERYIILGLKATANTAAVPLVADAMEVRDVLHKDLSVDLSMPALSAVGAETAVTATITNQGLDEATGYTVALYKGTQKVAEKTGPAVSFNQSVTVDFTYVPTVTDPEVVTFHAVVTLDGDENTQNDTSAEVATAVKQNAFPLAENVKAETADNGAVTLTWDAPHLEEASVTEEDFEGYLPWSISGIGKWTTYDANGAYTYSLGTEYPFEHAGYAYAFIVMNPTNWTLGTEAQNLLAPHSGSQYLASFCIQGATSHWLISPLLSGREQTVSLFAKSIDATMKETFEILYSTTDAAPASFTVLRTVKNVPVNWAEYTADLPAGTKYFAIRHCSNDLWALCLDDISYEPASLTVESYNIYRDGQFMGNTTSQTFTDETAGDSSHTYQVSVVYNEGESALTAAVSSTPAGIETLFSHLCGLRGTPDGIDIQGAEGLRVEVFTVDGRCLFDGPGRNNMSIPLSRGQYIVRIGGKAHKISTK